MLQTHPSVSSRAQDGLLLTFLRAPEALLGTDQSLVEQRRSAAASLIIIAICGALFGASVGWFRGGRQIAAAAIKLPLVTILTLVICGPAFAAISTTAGRTWRGRQALLALLVAGARSSLLLGAWAPLLWLGIELGFHYHHIRLVAALAYALAGLSALGFLLRTLGKTRGRSWAALGLSVVFLLVGGQSAWLLRPFIGAPEDAQVPLLVQRKEGGVMGSVVRSVRALQDSSR